MTEIIVLCVMGVIMSEIYVHTKRPKLYALINSLLGTGSMLCSQFLAGGEINISGYNAAFSAIAGVPATVLSLIIGG